MIGCPATRTCSLPTPRSSLQCTLPAACPDEPSGPACAHCVLSEGEELQRSVEPFTTARSLLLCCCHHSAHLPRPLPSSPPTIEHPPSCSPVFLYSPQPKIADFGLVREMEGSTLHMTHIVGTPGYMDPAYIKSCFATPSADVYRWANDQPLALYHPARVSAAYCVGSGSRCRECLLGTLCRGCVAGRHEMLLRPCRGCTARILSWTQGAVRRVDGLFVAHARHAARLVNR